jgi:hypothetical protein
VIYSNTTPAVGEVREMDVTAAFNAAVTNAWSYFGLHTLQSPEITVTHPYLRLYSSGSDEPVLLIERARTNLITDGDFSSAVARDMEQISVTIAETNANLWYAGEILNSLWDWNSNGYYIFNATSNQLSGLNFSQIFSMAPTGRYTLAFDYWEPLPFSSYCHVYVGGKNNGNTITYFGDPSSVGNGVRLTNWALPAGPAWQHFSKWIQVPASITNRTYLFVAFRVDDGAGGPASLAIDNVTLTPGIPPVELGPVSCSNNTIQLSITPATDKVTNYLERTYILPPTSWSTVTNLVITNGAAVWSDTLPAAWTQAYYRVRSRP